MGSTTGHRPGRAALAAALALCAACSLSRPAAAVAAEPTVALHAAVGDTLSRDEALRWGLFPDASDLRLAVFRAAPTGGYIARLHLDGPAGPRIRERNAGSRRCGRMSNQPW